MQRSSPLLFKPLPLRRTSLGLTSLLLASALLMPAPSTAANGCVRFDGIRHCPIGDAELQLAPNGTHLLATNLGPAGDDGVISRFQPTTHWEAEMSATGKNPGDRFEFLSISNGLATSGLTLVRQEDALISNGFFTGAQGANTYTLVVLNKGVMVGQVLNMGSSSSFRVVAGPDDDPWGPWDPGPIDPSDWPWWPPEPTFDIGSLGECSWALRFSTSIYVESTNPKEDRFLGDEIRLVENVGGAGHYAYTAFDAIVTLANSSALAVESEAVSGP